MVFEIDVTEIPVPPDTCLESTRLSLIEDYEKITTERLRQENELEHYNDGSKETAWRHSRDHGHDAGKPPLESPPGQAFYGLHNLEKDPNAPRDKGYYVLIVVCVFGLVHMLPFSFMMTATEYWMYKFRNTTSNSTDPNDRTYYQANFGAMGRLISTGPGVFCTFAAALIGHKVKAQTRIFMVLIVHTTILLAHTILAMTDTDEWQKTFFYLTLFLQMLMMCAMSLGGSGSMGLISKLPPRYMKAQLIGDGGSQLFSAVLRLVFIWITPSVVGSAIAYFITGVVLMAITSILLFFAVQTPFFRYYTHQRSKAERKEGMRNFKECKEIFLLLWPMFIITALPFLSPSHSITGLVVSEYFQTDSVWGKTFFVTTCSYLIPSVTGLIGRGVYNLWDIDCPIPLLLFLSISKEVFFGACTFLSNAHPRKHMPILLNHDWEYGLSMALGSFSSGFLANMSMMKLMRMCPINRIELGMMVNMFFLSVILVASSPIGMWGVSLL